MVAKTLVVQSKSRHVALLLGLLLVFYTVNGIFYIRAQSLTADEGSFLNYAIRLIKGHPERIHPTTDNSKMPVSVINLAPRAINQLLHPALRKKDSGVSDVFAGRYVTLTVSLMTLLLVFKWSAELYGEYAALFCVFLTSFCPNLMASSGLVTTDSYSALFLLSTVYSLWKFCNAPSAKHFILFSVFIALSQLVKQSLFHLYIICPVILCIHFAAHRVPVNWKRLTYFSIMFVAVNWLVINAGFYFKHTAASLGSYHFMSSTFSQLQQILPGWLPVPFPGAFITGLDMAKYYDQIGGGIPDTSSFGKVTILGHSSTGNGFWYYYFVSIFFKTPVSSLLFIIVSVGLLFKYRSPKEFLTKEFFLIVPIAYFLIYMSFMYKTQCGIRQMIFIYPFLYILCGSLVRYSRNTYLKAAIAVLSIYLIVSVLQYWRNYYPYTNEFVADKKMAFDFVGASNLEFLQGNNFFADYLKQHPAVKPVTSRPSTGIFLVNANDYLDIWNVHQYDWIQHIRPSGHVAYNGLIITVTQNDLDRLSIKHGAND